MRSTDSHPPGTNSRLLNGTPRLWVVSLEKFAIHCSHFHGYFVYLRLVESYSIVESLQVWCRRLSYCSFGAPPPFGKTCERGLEFLCVTPGSYLPPTGKNSCNPRADWACGRPGRRANLPANGPVYALVVTAGQSGGQTGLAGRLANTN